MIPFEILYGIRCNAPSIWDNLVDKLMIGPDILKEMEHKGDKEQNLKTTQDRQKSYADMKIEHKEFVFGDHIYLKVRHKRSSL